MIEIIINYDENYYIIKFMKEGNTMSQSVLVEKMKIFKELYKLALKIKKRPEYTFINTSGGRSPQRVRTENLPKIAETDSRFIIGTLYNSNPLYHLIFVTDESKEKIKGVYIESDFDCFKEIQDYINDNYYFDTKEKDQFKILENLTNLINMKLTATFENVGIFQSNEELNKYFDEFIKFITPCYEAIETIDFNSKKTILRIIKENIQFATTIKRFITPIDMDVFKEFSNNLGVLEKPKDGIFGTYNNIGDK